MSDTPLIFLTPAQANRISGPAVVRVLNKGEKLPFHTHVTEETNHFTVMICGRLRCFGRAAIEDKILKAGDIVDWIVGEGHGFEAEEDETTFIQVRKC